MNKLRKKLDYLPKKAGVYLFKKDKEILYVGKANNLKNRVASYFQKSVPLFAKQKMLGKINDLDYILTTNETEALFLETSLIKKYRPPYNVRFKDDKNFIYIKITNEDYPLIIFVRRISKDKAKYFGPYLSAWQARQTLNFLKRILSFRACKNLPKKACLLYHLGYCPAPCENKISKKSYQRIINKIIRFLKGDQEGILKDLRNEMAKAAQKREYERAAKLRDRIFILEKMVKNQKVIYPKDVNEDIISIAQEDDLAAVNLFTIRKGKLLDKKSFLLKNTEGLSQKEICQSFLNQYYSQTYDFPKEVVIPTKLVNNKILEKQYSFNINAVQKGRKFQLIKMGEDNAWDFLNKQKIYWQKTGEKSQKALLALKKELKLKTSLKRIEAYDISNIKGIDPVGSMIVFESGQPKKSEYRKFKIKTVMGINDPAMISEILHRRLKNKDWPKPNLIIVDGGWGQLNAALRVLPKNNKIPIIALAKRNEDIYTPNRKKPESLRRSSQALFLLQRIRDEAHRFAISYFRKKYKKESYKSHLDEIPSLGPKTKKKLLAKYESWDNIKKANKEELEPLIGRHKTKILKEHI